MMKVENTDLCPCCSGKSYSECCLPIMEGEKKAETAEQLMRARYSAYVTEHIEFLRDSSVKAVQEEFIAEMTTRWSRSARWHRLEIVATEKGGPKDKTGVVEFRAEYTAGEEFCNHHEKATFVKEKDGWKFEDGVFVSETPIVRETPKVGRNDLCPCGSGKKYKKCCGKA
jgi:SEC-C motif-containing protein